LTFKEIGLFNHFLNLHKKYRLGNTLIHGQRIWWATSFAKTSWIHNGRLIFGIISNGEIYFIIFSLCHTTLSFNWPLIKWKEVSDKYCRVMKNVRFDAAFKVVHEPEGVNGTTWGDKAWHTFLESSLPLVKEYMW